MNEVNIQLGAAIAKTIFEKASPKCAHHEPEGEKREKIITVYTFE